jgi:hypothetical protein
MHSWDWFEDDSFDPFAMAGLALELEGADAA